MVDFTNDISGGQGPVALGESLLSQAKERTAQNQRRRDKNAEKILLAQLGGKLVGSFLNKKFDNDLQAHLTSQNALAERALVRSSVDSANRITEQERAAQAHKAGRRAYYMDALTEQNKAYMQAHYAKTGLKPNESDIEVLAKQEAANAIDQYLAAIDKQVAAANSLVSVTGGDRLAYGKAIREAAGEGDNIIGRLGRRVATLFSKDNPGNSKDAIYRSTTTSQIYQSSEQFKKVFDSTFNMTGDSALAVRAGQAVAQGRIREATGASHELKDIKLPDGRTVTSLVQKDTDGNFVRAVPLTEDNELLSSESWGALSSATKNPVPKDRAAFIVSSTLEQLDDENLISDITDRTTGETEAQTKTRTENVATALQSSMGYLKKNFGDAMTENSRARISARMLEMDYKINGSQKEIYQNNIFLAAAAINEEYDGLENAPISTQRTLENNLNTFFDNETGSLGTMSSARIEEVAIMFDELPYSLTSQISFGEYDAADLLAFAHREASKREGYAPLSKDKLMPNYSSKKEGLSFNLFDFF